VDRGRPEGAGRQRPRRSLGNDARALLVELKALYNGRNNGELHMSVRETQQRLGVGRKLAEKALAELQDRGFIAVVQKGSFSCKVRFATTWRLTEHEHEGQPATKDFMRWASPAAAAKNTVLLRYTDDAPQGHRGPRKSGGNLHHGAPQGHRERLIGQADGAPQEHTVNMPSRGGRPAVGGTPAPPAKPPRALPRHRADGIGRLDSGGPMQPPSATDPVLFGGAVREARIARNLSRAQAARLAGLPRSVLDGIETGSLPAEPDTLERLAAVLGLPRAA
jgi:GNAT superfamily N-acetyltransferase